MTGHVLNATRPVLMVPEGCPVEDDESRWFTNVLVRKHAYRDLDADGFARLHSALLKRVMGVRWYKPTIHRLQAEGVIEVDSSYRIGDYSKGYRLAAPWLERRCQFVTATDERVIGRITSERERLEEEERARWLPTHFRLCEDAQRVSLTREAEALLEELPLHTHLCQSALVGSIRRRQFGFSVSKYGRVFNCICGLKRELRSCLLIDGQPTRCIDISCAQPALLGLLLRTLTACQCFPACETGQESSQVLKSRATHKACPPLPPLPLPCACPGVTGSDVDDWVALSEDGSLYGYLLCDLDWAPLRRDELKGKLMRDVFASGCRYPSEVVQAVKRLFPSIHRWIRLVTGQGSALLIQILQRLESWLVCETVAPLLDVPFVTLHDGAYFRRDDTARVQAAFHEAFELTGFRAQARSIEPVGS